jgi:hypothetical protein
MLSSNLQEAMVCLSVILEIQDDAMLKAIPNKNAGFIILLTSIFILFYFGEIRILIIFIRLMDYNNSFSIIFLLFIFLLFLWIGAQFPLEKFLSYGRILIFYYYSVCVCVLLSLTSYRLIIIHF